MSDAAESRALLLTGPYGAGKSALAAEIAGLLHGLGLTISDVSVMAMVAQRRGGASPSDGPAGTWADG